MKRIIVASAAALILAACSNDTAEPQEVVVVDDAPAATAEMVPEPAAAAITVSDAYILAPLVGRDVTAGYFTARNDGAAAALVSASSTVASEIELHTHTMTDGVMRMREVARIDMAAGETVTLEPGGLHLMLFGFTREDGQTEAPVTLRFENGEEMTLSVPIRERD
ncbi:MAG: copper chaperone PCu(A)C [Pseudomonadota bacterium]